VKTKKKTAKKAVVATAPVKAEASEPKKQRATDEVAEITVTRSGESAVVHVLPHPSLTHLTVTVHGRGVWSGTP
jgi:hypothetical protein